MSDRTIRVSLEDVKDIITEKLEQNGEIIYSPKGRSMLPFLKEGRDSVVLKKSEGDYKKGDIVFFKRLDGTFVLHRIIKVQKDNTFIICGDNQSVLEKNVSKDVIVAVVSRVIKGEKEVNLNGIFYKIYFNLLFIKRFKIRLFAKIKRIFSKK